MTRKEEVSISYTVAGRSNKGSYHHGDLRRALIDAALSLIEENGIHALSLREAARRAGVSSGAPYRHFEDKDALLVAISQEGELLLAEVTRQELARLEPGDVALEFKARGIAFVLFAALHSVHFRLMYSLDVRRLSREGVKCEVDEMESLLAADPTLRERATQVSIAGQCLAYGLARMIVDGELHPQAETTDQLRQFIDSILSVMGEGILSQ